MDMEFWAEQACSLHRFASLYWCGNPKFSSYSQEYIRDRPPSQLKMEKNDKPTVKITTRTSQNITNNLTSRECSGFRRIHETNLGSHIYSDYEISALLLYCSEISFSISIICHYISQEGLI